MRILRSVNRRGFSLGPAGWFTVVRSNRWFPASRLPDSFHQRHLSDPSKNAEDTAAPRQKGPGLADSQEATTPFQIMKRSADDRRLMQPALIVLAAAGTTFALLWWLTANALW